MAKPTKFACAHCRAENVCDTDKPKIVHLLESKEADTGFKTFCYECEKCGKLNTVRLKKK
jgi:hypothetical protein